MKTPRPRLRSDVDRHGSHGRARAGRGREELADGADVLRRQLLGEGLIITAPVVALDNAESPHENDFATLGNRYSAQPLGGNPLASEGNDPRGRRGGASSWTSAALHRTGAGNSEHGVASTERRNAWMSTGPCKADAVEADGTSRPTGVEVTVSNSPKPEQSRDQPRRKSTRATKPNPNVSGTSWAV
ncbi:hypothetical protein BS78_04G113000 [Paspalum vaginatum]|nr:hypothetical protein BS78_04G113000 [Paspalum vaginatum]